MSNNYTNILLFFLVIGFLATLKVEARESKYFSKLNSQVEQPPLKPSSEIKNFDGYHFDDDESDIPPEAFIENINKDSREYNERSPQGYKQKDGNNFYYPNKLNPTEGVHTTDAEVASSGFELTAEEKKFFKEKERMYSYNKDHETQGMSDTRNLENGRYYYKRRAESGNYNQYSGNRENKPKYDEFLPLKYFEYNPENQVGFIP